MNTATFTLGLGFAFVAMPGGVPFWTIGVMSFFLASVMLLAAIIAAGWFFSFRARVAKILPKQFTAGPMRALAILLLFWREVLLAVEGPRRSPVEVARPTRFGRAPTSSPAASHGCFRSVPQERGR